MEGGLAAHIRCIRCGCGGSNRNPDRDAHVGFSNAAVSLCDEMEVGGVGGRDGLGAVEIDIADAVNRDAAGVLAAPVEDDGLTLIDRDGIRGDGGGGGSGGGSGWGGTERVGIDTTGFLVAAGYHGECGEGGSQGQAFADSVVCCAHQNISCQSVVFQKISCLRSGLAGKKVLTSNSSSACQRRAQSMLVSACHRPAWS